MFNAAALSVPALPTMSAGAAFLTQTLPTAGRSGFRTLSTGITLGSLTVDENNVATLVEPRVLLDQPVSQDDSIYDIGTDTRFHCPLNLSSRTVMISQSNVTESEDRRVTVGILMLASNTDAMVAVKTCTLNESAVATIKNAALYQSTNLYSDGIAFAALASEPPTALRNGAAFSLSSAAQSQAFVDSTFNTSALAYWSYPDTFIACIAECHFVYRTDNASVYATPQSGDYYDGGNNPVFQFSQISHFAGRSRYFVCNVGLRVKDSDVNYVKITCNQNAEWEPGPPVCEPYPNRTCLPVIHPYYVPLSTIIHYNKHTLEEGTRATYECQSDQEFAGYGYSMTAMHRYCQADGTWSPDVLECVPKATCTAMRVRLGVTSITYTIERNSTTFVVDPATFSGGASNDGGAGSGVGGIVKLSVASAKPIALREGTTAQMLRPAAATADKNDVGDVMTESANLIVGNYSLIESPDFLEIDAQAYVTCKAGFVYYPTSFTFCSRVLTGTDASGGPIWGGSWAEDIMCIPMCNIAEARFDVAGTFVDITFTYPTTQPVPPYDVDGLSVHDTGGTFRTCSYLLANVTLELLGDTKTAGCHWRTASVLRIRLGFSFTLRPASTVTFMGGIIKPAVRVTNSAFYPSINLAFVPFMPQVTATVRAPVVLPRLFVDLSAPSTIGSCASLSLLVRSIIGHAGMVPSMAFELVNNGSNGAAVSAFKVLVNRIAPYNMNTAFSALTSPAPAFSASFNVTELDTFFPVDTTATFSVRVTNWLGTEFVATVNVTRLSTDGPLISILAGRSNTYAAADAITVVPRVTLSSCSVASGREFISYKWGPLPNETLPTLFAATVAPLNQSALFIPPFTLPPGVSYRFRLCVTSGLPSSVPTHVTVCERIKIIIKSMPLVAHLALRPFAQQRFSPTVAVASVTGTVASPPVRIFESSFSYVYEPSITDGGTSNLQTGLNGTTESAAASLRQQEFAPAATMNPLSSIEYGGVALSPNEKLTLYANGTSDPDLSTTDPDTLLYSWSCYRRYHSPTLINTIVPMDWTIRSTMTHADLATNSSLAQLQLTAELLVLQNASVPCFAVGSEGANILKSTKSIVTLPPAVMAALAETDAERASVVGQRTDAMVAIYFSVTAFYPSDYSRVSTAVLAGTVKRGNKYYVNAAAVPHPQYATGVFPSTEHLRLSAQVAAKDSKYAVLWTCESGQLNLTGPYVTVGKRSLTTLVINATALSPDTVYTFRVHIFAVDSAYPRSPPPATALTAADNMKIPGELLPDALSSAIVTVVTAPMASAGRCQVDPSVPTSQAIYAVRCYGFTTAESVLPLSYRWHMAAPSLAQSVNSTALTSLLLDPVAMSRMSKLLLHTTRVDPVRYFSFFPREAQILVEVIDAVGVNTWATFTLPAAPAATVDTSGTEEEQAAALLLLKQNKLKSLIVETRAAVASQRASDIIQSFSILVASARELGAQVEFAVAVALMHEIIDGKLDVSFANMENLDSLPFFTGSATVASDSDAFVQGEQPTMTASHPEPEFAGLQSAMSAIKTLSTATKSSRVSSSRNTFNTAATSNTTTTTTRGAQLSVVLVNYFAGVAYVAASDINKLAAAAAATAAASETTSNTTATEATTTSTSAYPRLRQAGLLRAEFAAVLRAIGVLSSNNTVLNITSVSLLDNLGTTALFAFKDDALTSAATSDGAWTAFTSVWNLWKRLLAYQKRHVMALANSGTRHTAVLLDSTVSTIMSGVFIMQRLSGFMALGPTIDSMVEHITSLMPSFTALALRGKVANEAPVVMGNSALVFTFLRSSTQMQVDATIVPRMSDVSALSVKFNMSNVIFSAKSVGNAPFDVPSTRSRSSSSNKRPLGTTGDDWDGVRLVNNEEIVTNSPNDDESVGSITVPEALLSMHALNGYESADIAVCRLFSGGALSIVTGSSVASQASTTTNATAEAAEASNIVSDTPTVAPFSTMSISSVLPGFPDLSLPSGPFAEHDRAMSVTDIFSTQEALTDA